MRLGEKKGLFGRWVGSKLVVARVSLTKRYHEDGVLST
jgi:hypothetical protein